MTCHRPGCIGNYDFDRIAFYAKRRFVDGCDTVSLLAQACSQREREEICLVALLSIDDAEVSDLKLSCRHVGQCKVLDCREKLKQLVERDLAS